MGFVQTTEEVIEYTMSHLVEDIIQRNDETLVRSFLFYFSEAALWRTKKAFLLKCMNYLIWIYNHLPKDAQTMQALVLTNMSNMLKTFSRSVFLADQLVAICMSFLKETDTTRNASTETGAQGVFS
jgi:hypothetical protein